MRLVAILLVALLGTLPAAAQPPRPRILVLDPSMAGGLDASLAPTLASMTAAALARRTTAEIVAGHDLVKLLQLEQQKELLGCADESCVAEIAGALGADLVVTGDAGKLGSVLVVNLALLDTKTARAVARTSVRAASLDDLAARMNPAVEVLAEKCPGYGSGTVRHPGWGLVAGGAAAAVAGLAFDLLSPTSANHRLDGGDFVGPTFEVGGAVCLLVGLLGTEEAAP